MEAKALREIRAEEWRGAQMLIAAQEGIFVYTRLW